jgi:hypothetical protein
VKHIIFDEPTIIARSSLTHENIVLLEEIACKAETEFCDSASSCLGDPYNREGDLEMSHKMQKGLCTVAGR